MTPETIGKLEQAFAFDATIEEACLYAGIHPDTYYEFVKKKENKTYSEHFEQLRHTPVLTARNKVVSSLKEDANLAFKYLERKRKGEFGERKELTGADGKPLTIQISQEAAEKYNVPNSQTGDNS